MKTAIIVQARMGSSRLPGKVLMPVNGKPLLLYQMERLRRSCVPLIILATTTSTLDDELCKMAARWSLPVFRGLENNVLERYIQAAEQYDVECIIRSTGDCPLIDPNVVDKALSLFKNCDYLSNTLIRTYPRGLDVEVFTLSALKEAQKLAVSEGDLEHVTPVLYRSGFFRTAHFENEEDLSRYRLCVDTQEDFCLIQKILSSLQHPNYSLRDLIVLLEKHPDWPLINQNIKQKGIE